MAEKSGQQKVVLSTSQWISLLLTVAGMIAAGIWGAHTIETRLGEKIVEMDQRWQKRTLELSRELRMDIKGVEDKIPPDWFRAMVDANARAIKDLETEFTRDFLRKSELDIVLKTRKGVEDGR